MEHYLIRKQLLWHSNKKPSTWCEPGTDWRKKLDHNYLHSYKIHSIQHYFKCKVQLSFTLSKLKITARL